jgi:hypothetical protein
MFKVIFANNNNNVRNTRILMLITVCYCSLWWILLMSHMSLGSAYCSFFCIESMHICCLEHDSINFYVFCDESHVLPILWLHAEVHSLTLSTSHSSCYHTIQFQMSFSSLSFICYVFICCHAPYNWMVRDDAQVLEAWNWLQSFSFIVNAILFCSPSPSWISLFLPSYCLW